MANYQMNMKEDHQINNEKFLKYCCSDTIEKVKFYVEEKKVRPDLNRCKGLSQALYNNSVNVIHYLMSKDEVTNSVYFKEVINKNKNNNSKKIVEKINAIKSF